MPATVIDIQNVDDLRDVVHRAVQALAEGKLVAFPTETVYGVAASALDDSAVERLRDLRPGANELPLTLAVKSRDEALDYVPQISPLGSRLARRCWPGPVTLVVEKDGDTLWNYLPERTRQITSAENSIGLRVPAHELIIETMRMLVGPLVLTSVQKGNEPEAITGKEVIEALGDRVQLVLDDGRSRYGQPSTVVRVRGNDLEILREGVVPEATLRRLASLFIAFICTGNTCRSPMAEALCRAMLAERIGCAPDELDKHGVMVASAGVSATMGNRASPEGVDVLRDMGISMSDHQSQPVTEQIVKQADVILAMTQAHRTVLLSHFPEAAERVHLVCSDRSDISDPIGGPVEEYRRCAQQIRRELGPWLDQLGYPEKKAS